MISSCLIPNNKVCVFSLIRTPCYNQTVTHSDALYLRCVYCQKIVLLARTNVHTRQFSDWAKLEAFIRAHLACNPYFVGENLLGIPGFEVFAASESIYNAAKLEAAFRRFNDTANGMVDDMLEGDDED